VPEHDAIAVAGKTQPAPVWRTIAFHKPRGTVTTRRDPQGRRTVFDVLGEAADGLVAVGRLDLATSGLLLLTSDTRLADALTDPANAVVRRYVVTVRGEVGDAQRETLERGVGGLAASRVEIRKRSRRETHLIVELTEGKNREIRRLCEALGLEVDRLVRVKFGPVELGDLGVGKVRSLTRAEIKALEKM